jgi:hypothetical protein
MRFDIAKALDNSTAHRAMMRAAIRRKVSLTRARGVAEAPGRRSDFGGRMTAPAVTLDELPEFMVVVVVRPQGSRYVAELRWMLDKANGSFPVIPESAAPAKVKRQARFKAHQFRSEDEAIREGARQSVDLVDDFIQWATGVDDGV